MAPFFDVVYALVVLLVSGIVGALPVFVARVFSPFPDRALALPAVPIAVAWWIWAGWLGGLYGISRFELVVFAAISAAGFVRGWLAGIVAGRRIRRRVAARRRGMGPPPDQRLAVR